MSQTPTPEPDDTGKIFEYPPMIRLGNGRTAYLPLTMTSFQYDGEWYFTTCSVLRKPSQIWKSRRSAYDALSSWTICVTKGLTCEISDDGKELTVPGGSYRSSRAISEVVESRGLFVLGFRNGFDNAPSPVVCIDGDGSVRWELPATHSGMASQASDDHTICIGRYNVEDFVDIDSGAVLSTRLSH